MARRSVCHVSGRCADLPAFGLSGDRGEHGLQRRGDAQGENAQSFIRLAGNTGHGGQRDKQPHEIGAGQGIFA